MASGRTPAQLFCLFGGGLLLARGLVGFALLDSSFDTPGEGWHHLIHLVSGVLLIGAYRLGEGVARFAALVFGIGYTTLALAGIADGNDAFGLIAADIADKTFHVVVGLASLAAGLVGRPAAPAAAA